MHKKLSVAFLAATLPWLAWSATAQEKGKIDKGDVPTKGGGRPGSPGVTYTNRAAAARVDPPSGAGLRLYTVTSDGKSFTINGFNKSEFTLALASDDRIVLQGGMAAFHPSTTFADQYAKGSLRVGTVSGSGNIWAVRGPLEDGRVGSWSRSTKPPRLPEDGKSVTIPAKELQGVDPDNTGGKALWLLSFSTGPREQCPTFLIVATLPAQEKGKPDKGDQQAKEVAEQFLKALSQPDLEAVMKTVDIPFCLQGRENIKDRERLKKIVDRMKLLLANKI